MVCLLMCFMTNGIFIVIMILFYGGFSGVMVMMILKVSDSFLQGLACVVSFGAERSDAPVWSGCRIRKRDIFAYLPQKTIIKNISTKSHIQQLSERALCDTAFKFINVLF